MCVCVQTRVFVDLFACKIEKEAWGECVCVCVCMHSERKLQANANVHRLGNAFVENVETLAHFPFEMCITQSHGGLMTVSPILFSSNLTFRCAFSIPYFIFFIIHLFIHFCCSWSLSLAHMSNTRNGQRNELPKCEQTSKTLSHDIYSFV